MNTQNNNYQNKLRINHFIRVPQVRVIDSDGNPIGVMSTAEALKLAQEQGLDLIEINPKVMPPICRVMNFGKFKYEEKKKQSEAKKNQKVQELKEITFRPNTDENDLNHKLVQAKEFLTEGNRVKFTIRFRGREVMHAQIGRDKIQWILTQLSGLIVANPLVSMEGKFMTTIVFPIKKQ